MDYQVPFQKKSTAAEFRQTARGALTGKYWLALGVFLLASILAAFSSTVSFSIDTPDAQTISRFSELLQSGAYRTLAEEIVRFFFGSGSFVSILLFFTGISAILSVGLSLFVGAPTAVGYARFNLELLDREVHPISESLFSAFSKNYWTSVKVRVLITLINLALSIPPMIPVAIAVGLVMAKASGVLILLMLGIGMLLSIAFAIFSVIVNYRYALCTYILAEYPELSAIDVLKNSASLMRGNKFRMFCLQLSFIGWILLSILTCGIGMVFLSPYLYAADAAFYHEVSGRQTAKTVEFPSLNPEDYFSDDL